MKFENFGEAVKLKNRIDYLTYEINRLGDDHISVSFFETGRVSKGVLFSADLGCGTDICAMAREFRDKLVAKMKDDREKLIHKFEKL